MITECLNYFKEFFFCKGWIYLIGYSISLLISYFFIKKLMRKMWYQLSEYMEECYKDNNSAYEIFIFNKNTRDTFLWQSFLIGSIDTFLYMTSFLIGYPEFIMVWLVFKITGRWGYLTKYPKEINLFNREFNNFFVIGNALTIIYSILCAKAIKLLVECNSNCGAVIFGIIGVISLSIALYVYVSIKTKKSEK